MGLTDIIHGRWVAQRRVRVLSERLAPAIPVRATVLDVGAGDGALAAAIKAKRPDITVAGLDVLVRPGAAISVTAFDGKLIPRPDRSVDVAMLVDVLHHADDPTALLKEASRVAAKGVLVKDHVVRGMLARSTLRFMDGVGNARFGVALPHNYLTEREWHDAFSAARLRVGECWQRLGLYPRPASLWFDRQLHFVAWLTPAP